VAAGYEPDDLRARIDVAVDHGDTRAAIEGLARLWRREPGPAAAGFVNTRRARLDQKAARRTLNVAILRSFTVEPLVPVLRAAGFVSGLDLTVHVGDFNTYAQEILNPESPAYGAWNPDAVILAIQTRDIAPDLWDGFSALDAKAAGAAVERVSNELELLVTAFRRQSDAHLVVHGLELPAERALGIADDQETLGQLAAVRAINERLAALCRTVPGVHLLDMDALISAHGRLTWFDARKWAAMRVPIRSDHHARVAAEWLRYLGPIAGLSAKALVVDLDNTIWGGVLGEDGPEGIVLGREGGGLAYHDVQRALLDIRGRGVLLAICSKNNHDEVMDVLQNHPEMLLRPSDFVAIRANWDDKATNIVSIADELNIGVDAIVFADDSPVECELVRRRLPEVTVLELDGEPSTFAARVRGSAWFERLSLSEDDRQRSAQYARRRSAQDLQAQAASLDEFLMSLATTVDVSAADGPSVARVAQLTQKTNQFNLTTRRYSEQQIADLTTSAGTRVYAAQVADRFGEHGLVGVAIVQCGPGEWEIDTFLLSCRVIGRSVETALLSAVAADATAAGVEFLEGDLIETAKNGPALGFYREHGFVKTRDDDAATRWRLDLTTGGVAVPRWISLSAAARATEHEPGRMLAPAGPEAG
jgi:FkbH-like protein